MAYEADTTQDILKKTFNVSSDAIQVLLVGGATLTVGNISLEGNPSEAPVDASSTYGLEVDVTRLPDNVAANISSIQNDISSVQDNISAVQDDISTMQVDVSQIQVAISNIDQNVSTSQNDISSIQDDISIIQNDISQIQAAVSTIQQDTSVFQNDLSNIQDDISVMQIDISQIQVAVSNIDQNISTSQNDLSSIQDDISTIQPDISQMQAAISTIQQDTSTVQNDTSQIKAYASTIASALINEDVSRVRIADTWTSGVHGIRSTISTAAVRIALGASTALKRGMLCRAHRDNATIIYVGFSGVTGETTASTCGHPLEANQSFLIEANNSFSLYAIANATAQKLHYFGI